MGSSNTELNNDSATESDDATKMDADTEKTETHDDSPPVFEENEKVLAFHCKHIYDAKVKKVHYRKKGTIYFVHYLGWNNIWDEWVSVDCLLKRTDENVQRQLANNKTIESKNLKLGHASQMKPRSTDVARGKKRKNDCLDKEKGHIPMENFVNFQIPPTLQKQLVDDCGLITHLGKLVKLPCTPTVDDILEKYRHYRLEKDGLIADSTREMIKGLHSFFDKALPIMLLYKSERQQYEDTMAVMVAPSTIYGAEHLLRLFVKLPELLVHAKIEEETSTKLQQMLLDFLEFLRKNQSSFFLSTYHIAEDVETSTNVKEDD
ncbi:protein MRG2-like isoform X2 [Pistacia vera]|uniref:protein MRG2-like isoform X2 n=1 Tax=Pistacia vera TaxID=55513 RepID=UPI001262E451|nr:protein MRG2-like isoform X2 [Pistacia vera]